MDFPFVVELLEYWIKYPPSHLLLRALAGYGESKEPSRDRKAHEMGDEKVIMQQPPTKAGSPELNVPTELVGAARTKHIDCAPGHIQAAIERAKNNTHLEVPQ